MQNHKQIIANLNDFWGVKFYKLNKNEILVRSFKALLSEAYIL